MVTTLLKYCDQHKRPDGDLVKIVDKYGLAEPIQKMFSVFHKPIKTKKCTYWHWGASNTGKTEFKKLLD
jgi:hypothetical protein